MYTSSTVVPSSVEKVFTHRTKPGATMNSDDAARNDTDYHGRIKKLKFSLNMFGFVGHRPGKF